MCCDICDVCRADRENKKYILLTIAPHTDIFGKMKEDMMECEIVTLYTN